MSTLPELTRRRFLVGLGAAAAAGLAACASPAPSLGPTRPPVASSSGGQRAPSSAPSSAPPSAIAGGSPSPASGGTSDRAALERKVARMVMTGFRGDSVTAHDAISVALAAGLGGVILFDRDQTTKAARNIVSPAQVARLTGQLRRAAPGPILIAVDQEGGRVARLGPATGFAKTRSEAAIGRTDDPAVARAAGRAMGKTMRDVGIDLDLAPVVDVDVDPRNPAIGALDRSFSADPDVVAAMAEAEIGGLHDRGVKAAIKHFPGLGSATANTDFDRVDVTSTWARSELRPYETLIGLGAPDLVMVGHILDRDLDPDRPASLSPAVIGGLLRDQLGWDGPVMTDDLGAVAITSTVARREAIAQAVEAGNDLLLFANQAAYEEDLAKTVVRTLADLVVDGRLSESRIDASIARLDRLVAAPS